LLLLCLSFALILLTAAHPGANPASSGSVFADHRVFWAKWMPALAMGFEGLGVYVSALIYAIGHVLLTSALKQVGWVNAPSVVASMANVEPGLNFPFKHPEAHAVSILIFAIKPDPTIP